MRGIYDIIRTLAQRLHQLTFRQNSRLQGSGLLHQWMAPTGLLIALDDRFRGCLQKQQAAHTAAVLERIQNGKQLRADSVYQRHPVIAATAPGAELCKFQNHGGGHIVHNIKAHIL